MMEFFTVLVLVLIVVVVLRRRRRAVPSLPPVAGESTVAIDEAGITHRAVNGQSDRVRWDELREIIVVTNDHGPFADDVHWLFLGAVGVPVCAVPQSAVGADAMVARVQQLPGFRHDRLVEAMGSTQNARFTVWTREASA